MNPRKHLLVLVPVCVALVGAMWPVDAAAQRRGVRGGPVRTVIVGPRYYSSPLLSYPYYYDPFWFGWDYPYRPYPPYPRYAYEPGAELRIQVKPHDAEVYIDGYLVGTVDDFDGVFQRLRVPYGEHAITVYLAGYRSITERMLFRPYESYHIKQPMQPLPAGEAAAPRPVPTEQPASQAPAQGPGPGAGRLAPGRVPGDRGGDRAPASGADRFGAVAIRVQPADAAVFIDGERWDAPSGDSRLLVELSEGTHRVEIRKDGFKTYSTTLSVRAGETLPLNVSLPHGD